MSYQLTFESTGQVLEVEEGQTILDAALRAGIYLPHACCHGLCATCKIDVTDGEIDHGEASNFALMDYEREEGKALACCATLQSDVTIDAEIEEEPDALNLPVQDYRGTVSRIEDLTPTVKGVWITLDAPTDMVFQAGQYINLHQADQLPYLFLAGGSGLSSPRSMILDLLAQGCDRPIALVNGARHQPELYHHDEFMALAAQHGNFDYVPVLSNEPEASGWTGARGFVHDAAKAHFDNDFRGRKAYLCGPPLMIEACIKTLMQGRLFERDIYTEKFISAADAQQVRSPLFRKL
jgi:phenol hydroxylase P5 protein